HNHPKPERTQHTQLPTLGNTEIKNNQEVITANRKLEQPNEITEETTPHQPQTTLEKLSVSDVTVNSQTVTHRGSQDLKEYGVTDNVKKKIPK
ncbi:hypothetical protein, partial [Pseudophaeobacter profundi]|uniref:hypothetical protein n=1 Tax=Pseudophaeobacter profundi TaxID=3034152 RepID=UPI00242F4749